LSTTEVEKRTQSFNARRALLRSNPSLYVSRTRLSIRQLPLFVTERMLKRLAIHAVRAFEAEVKQGTRAGLTADELAERVAEDAAEDDTPSAEKAKSKGKGRAHDKKGKGRDTGVRQAKIVRQQDRVDPVTGKGRSRGYGFLEMGTHAGALRVLRWANNNPGVGTLFAAWWKEELEALVKAEKTKEKKEDGRLERLKAELAEDAPRRAPRGTLVVEFSIENVQVVKRRVAHQQEQKSVSARDVSLSYSCLAHASIGACRGQEGRSQAVAARREGGRRGPAGAQKAAGVGSCRPG
jgi:nucleolar protein 4